MEILAVGVAHPGPRRQQSELLNELINAWGDKVTDRERQLLERLAKSAGVTSKHLSLDPKDYAKTRTFTERNKIFIDTAERLAKEAILSALSQKNCSARAIDAIFFTTVTGIAVPSIDARVASALAMREDIKRIPMFGLGCVAGAAGLARVHDYLKAWPKQVALLLSVELCSLTLQLDDLSAESIVSSALFGDGCAAVLCVGAEHPLAAQSRLTTVATKSRLYPDSAHIMGWDIGSHGFKILLDPGVSNVVERYYADDVKSFLATHELTIQDVTSWISHPGGPKVLKAIEATLGLPEAALAKSRHHLAAYGNLSSASVLGILDETMRTDGVDPSKRHQWAMLMAMGPGFCSEQVLCRWAQ